MKDNTALVTIRSFIEQDELYKAMVILYKLAEVSCSDIKNEISVLRGRLSRLEKELRMGTLKYSEISSEKTQIALSILSLAEIVYSTEDCPTNLFNQ